jgi:hypothetical protein
MQFVVVEVCANLIFPAAEARVPIPAIAGISKTAVNRMAKRRMTASRVPVAKHHHSAMAAARE